MHQDNIEISLEPITSERLIDKGDASHVPNWRPSCLKLPFLIGAVGVTLLHSALCGVLLFLSYTDSTLLTFPASSVGPYMFWQFVPITLAVVPGLIWEIAYIAMCRMQPYQDLASPQGSTLKDGLSQNYLNSLSWFVPYQALKHPKKHTAVAMMAIAYLLSYGVLPTATAAMIKIHWDDVTTPAEGTAQPLIYFVILAFIVSISTLAFAITAFLVSHQHKSGVYGDPASIAGLGVLVAESNILDKFRSLHSFETQEGIDEALGPYQLCLEHTSGHQSSYQISLLDQSQAVTQVPNQTFVRDSVEAHPWWLRGKTYIGLIIVAIVPQIVIQTTISNNITAGNVFVVKICYTILTVLNAAVYANWHLNVAILQPFYDLTENSHINSDKSGDLAGSSDALEHDFTRSAISKLTQKWQSLAVWWMAMCAFLTQLSVVVNPAVYQNQAFMVALVLEDLDPSYSDVVVPHGVRTTTYLSYGFSGTYALFTLIGLILVMARRRKPFLPRKPHTLSSVILYLSHGTELLEDLKGMSTLSKKARDRRLTRNGNKYGLGWIEDEDNEYSRVGIDRVEKITSRFKYPKAEKRREFVRLDKPEYPVCWPSKVR